MTLLSLLSNMHLACLVYVTFQALKDTGVHHMHLLLILSRLSTLCFLPFWLMFDVSRIVQDNNVVRIKSGIIVILVNHDFFFVLAVKLLSSSAAFRGQYFVILNGHLQNKLTYIKQPTVIKGHFLLCFLTGCFRQI